MVGGFGEGVFVGMDNSEKGVEEVIGIEWSRRGFMVGAVEETALVESLASGCGTKTTSSGGKMAYLKRAIKSATLHSTRSSTGGSL